MVNILSAILVGKNAVMPLMGSLKTCLLSGKKLRIVCVVKLCKNCAFLLKV